MDWSFNTIWFDQLSDKAFQRSDWTQIKGAFSLDPALEYLIVSHHKADEKCLVNLPLARNLKYLELNWSNSKCLTGIGKFTGLKRLELHYCTKLETLADIQEISGSIEHLHIDMSKKLTDLEQLTSLSGLRVLRLNSCGEIDNLDFLKHLPNLVDFRFVKTNILDGNLLPLIEHPSISSVGFFDKRHYNMKCADVEKVVGERHPGQYVNEIWDGDRRTFAWPRADSK